MAYFVDQPLHRGDRRMIFQLDRLATTLALNRAAQPQRTIGDAKCSTANGAVARRADVIQVVRHLAMIRLIGRRRQRLWRHLPRDERRSAGIA